MLTEAIIVTLIGALAGTIAGWFQTRGVNKKATTEAAKIVQDMAIQIATEEKEKRQDLEIKLNKKIAELEKENKTLLERVRAQHEELRALQNEKKDWQAEEDRLERKISDLRKEKDRELTALRMEKDEQLNVIRQELQSIRAEKEHVEQERSRLEQRISTLQLEKDQEKLRMETKVKELQQAVTQLNKKTGSLSK